MRTGMYGAVAGASGRPLPLCRFALACRRNRFAATLVQWV